MNHVNLNTASETVRQVILSFSANGGTVFELDGQPIAWLIPFVERLPTKKMSKPPEDPLDPCPDIVVF